MNATKTFKSHEGREIAEGDVGKEIVRLARRLQMTNQGMAFSVARDLILESEPALAKAYIGTDEGE